MHKLGTLMGTEGILLNWDLSPAVFLIRMGASITNLVERLTLFFGKE